MSCLMLSLMELRNNACTGSRKDMTRAIWSKLVTPGADSIRAMRELRQIDLRGNPVISLPEGLTTLPRLEKLDLRWVTTWEPPQWFSDLETNGCVIYL